MIHTVSDELSELLQEGWSIPAERLLTIPLGLETERFPAVDPAERPDRGRLLVTRRHDPVYDQGTLVKALGLLRAEGRAARLTFACGAALRIRGDSPLSSRGS